MDSEQSRSARWRPSALAVCVSRHFRYARDDALVKAAEYVLDAQAAAGPDTVATIGRLEVEPGAVNLVPARVTLSVDARAHGQANTLSGSVMPTFQTPASTIS